MNLVVAAPSWLLGVFGCALVAAAIEDALRLRISNVTILFVFAGAIAASVLEGPSWMLWQNILAFAAILTIGTFAFSAGLLGGGDVKLFAATALWFDLKSSALVRGAHLHCRRCRCCRLSVEPAVERTYSRQKEGAARSLWDRDRGWSADPRVPRPRTVRTKAPSSGANKLRSPPALATSDATRRVARRTPRQGLRFPLWHSR